MQWQDEGYLLSKNNFDENSIIIDAFTQNHGKYTGIVYGGSSRKVKRNFQIGNKILINWKSKSENKMGYFTVELIEPIAPYFFDDKKRSICILAASSLLKILLPDRQINKKIYESFDKLISDLKENNWIKLYIYWELSIIKELGFEVNFLNKHMNTSNRTVQINGKEIKVPSLLINNKSRKNTDAEITEALNFNKTMLLENIISPNRLKFPLSRNILEKYYN